MTFFHGLWYEEVSAFDFSIVYYWFCRLKILSFANSMGQSCWQSWPSFANNFGPYCWQSWASPRNARRLCQQLRPMLLAKQTIGKAGLLCQQPCPADLPTAWTDAVGKPSCW
jgi:hypothetical protein